MITNNIVDLIGNTPLIKLKYPSEITQCEIYGKAEFLNPGGSIKDRTALGIILDAEKNNLIEPNGICVEGTFGNTGIGLTLVNNARGYKTVIVMPNITVPSKRDILRNMGAELHLVDPKPFSDPGNYQRVSERLAKELLDSSLKNSSLKNGGKPFVFYDRDSNTGKLTKPESIIAGRAYWFKHKYAENVIFTNHNTDGTAVPLVDYDISLKEGWNMIGSPFSFPVSVKEYDGNPNPLYTYGYDDSTNSDGWVEPTSTLYPWSGYTAKIASYLA